VLTKAGFARPKMFLKTRKPNAVVSVDVVAKRWVCQAVPGRCFRRTEAVPGSSTPRGERLAELPRENRVYPTSRGGALPKGRWCCSMEPDNVRRFQQQTMTEENCFAQGADINFNGLGGILDLHLSSAFPHMPKTNRTETRGNSGLYLQSRYECQVLDSFGEAEPVQSGWGGCNRFKTPEDEHGVPAADVANV